MRIRPGAVVAVAALCSLPANAAAQEPFELPGPDGARFRVAPATLRVERVDRSGEALELTRATAALGPVADLRQQTEVASWRLPEAGLRVEARAAGGRLRVAIARETPGALVWPRLPLAGAVALAVPAFEGVHVRLDDEALVDWLRRRGEQSMTAELSLPFVGVRRAAHTVTCIVPAPYYDTLALDGGGDGALELRITHRWTPNRPGSRHVVVFAVAGAEALASARAYRGWLADRGELVSLRAKIAAGPAVARLLGAPHAYLWGSSYLSHLDIPRPQWRPFARALLDRARADSDSIAGRLVARLSTEGRAALEEIAGLEYPYAYVKTVAADAISAALRELDGRPDEAEAARVLRHARALTAAFPAALSDPTRWGDGVSIALLDAIRAAGIDRMLLCTADLDDSRLKPHVVARARELGFLFGPYDSYHSIHDPDAPADATWATAQFDRALYESGGVVGLDGERGRGFRRRGFHLSPAAARPYVEARVGARMARAPYGAWFVDCDGYGQFFDDVHPEHAATRLDDAAARRDRLRWLARRHGLVVGSEGATAVMASALHFAHGVMTPVFGWGDPELDDRQSP